MSDVLKTCPCGRTFTFDQWRELPGCGRMDDGDGGALDLRNCPCGSTIAVDVAILQEDDRLAFEIRRDARLLRLISAAETATDLALRYASEDQVDGVDARQDRRIVDASRQAAEYLRAAHRIRAMTFNSDDCVLVASMTEELRPTG